MTRLVARAVRDFVAASPGSGTYAALVAGALVEAATVPGLAAIGAVLGDVAWREPAIGAALGVPVATLLGGLAVGYGVGDGRAIDALGHPATWAYAVLPLLARWLVVVGLLERLAPAGSYLLGDTTFLAGVVTPAAVVGCACGAVLAPAPPTQPRDDRSV